jgi:hypothetical protein
LVIAAIWASAASSGVPICSASTNYGCDQSDERNQLTPGPLIAYTVTFEYAKSYQPLPTIRLAISELIYTTPYLGQRGRGLEERDLLLPAPPTGSGAALDRWLINRPEAASTQTKLKANKIKANHGLISPEDHGHPQGELRSQPAQQVNGPAAAAATRRVRCRPPGS